MTLVINWDLPYFRLQRRFKYLDLNDVQFQFLKMPNNSKLDNGVSQSIDRNHVVYLFVFSCRDVFPQGLPDEYAFVTTFKFRKTSRREDWYLWQVFDKYGIPQVGWPTENRKLIWLLFV